MKTNNNQSCVCGGCNLIGAIVGIIAGVVVAILFSGGNISLITNGIWIAFGLAVFILLYLLGTLLLSSCTGSCCVAIRCLRRNLGCLLIGIIGTILTALAALSTALTTSAIVIVILVGLVAFFFTFLIVAIISYIKCLANVD